jgi:hypothetical protein
LAEKSETKDVLEMFSEFFREAAVLVLIFYPLELQKNGSISFLFMGFVGCVCLVLLMMGVVLEKLRGG